MAECSCRLLSAINASPRAGSTLTKRSSCAADSSASATKNRKCRDRAESRRTKACSSGASSGLIDRTTTSDPSVSRNACPSRAAIMVRSHLFASVACCLQRGGLPRRHPPQFVARTRKSRHHGSNRYPERRGNLFVVHALDRNEHQHFALLGGQPLHLPHDFLQFDTCGRIVVSGDLQRRAVLVFGIERDVGCIAPGGRELVDEDVVHDGEQPRTQIRSLAPIASLVP